MNKIPKSLIPITRYKNGEYFSREYLIPIPKHWTVYRVGDNVITDNGELKESDLTDWKGVGKLKKPYRWYVAIANNPDFKTPYVLKEESPPPSPPASPPSSSSRKVYSRGGKKSRTRRGTRRRNRRGTRRR
jgi:hypothetical protein